VHIVYLRRPNSYYLRIYAFLELQPEAELAVVEQTKTRCRYSQLTLHKSKFTLDGVNKNI